MIWRPLDGPTMMFREGAPTFPRTPSLQREKGKQVCDQRSTHVLVWPLLAMVAATGAGGEAYLEEEASAG
ncbi:hypothetical protein RCCGEPOP_24437 [Rhizobium sp. Pop5]|nr:hypothetical protein RCCGEPOP_24437 [Rhizobium sp. Pop5]